MKSMLYQDVPVARDWRSSNPILLGRSESLVYYRPYSFKSIKTSPNICQYFPWHLVLHEGNIYHHVKHRHCYLAYQPRDEVRKPDRDQAYRSHPILPALDVNDHSTEPIEWIVSNKYHPCACHRPTHTWQFPLKGVRDVSEYIFGLLFTRTAWIHYFKPGGKPA